MSELITSRLSTAARSLRVPDPEPFVGRLIERTFSLPIGDPRYAANALLPGAAPCEPQFSEGHGRVLQFAIEPLTPGASPISRRDEATREMRRLIAPVFGSGALSWFDRHSEEWRGMSAPGGLEYGAWFEAALDPSGLRSSTVTYELHPTQVASLHPRLSSLVTLARDALPGLVPVHTSISCSRESGSQRVTFLHNGPLRLADLEPFMRSIGLAHQLPGLMQIVGLALGGRFDLPHGSVLIGLRASPAGPEFEFEVLLSRVPDVPAAFLDLLALGLAERPRELHSLSTWLQAFTPESAQWPGDIHVLRIRTSATEQPRVSLHLRPIEFEIADADAERPVAVG